MTSPTAGVMCVSEDKTMFQRVMEEFNTYEQAVSCSQTLSFKHLTLYKWLCSNRHRPRVILSLTTVEYFRS